LTTLRSEDILQSSVLPQQTFQPEICVSLLYSSRVVFVAKR